MRKMWDFDSDNDWYEERKTERANSAWEGVRFFICYVTLLGLVMYGLYTLATMPVTP